jgi:hypothetical protein
MAGGLSGKFNPKTQKSPKFGFSSEVLKDSQDNFSVKKSENKPLFSLNGVLSLGKTAEIGKAQENLHKNSEKVFYGINHLEQDAKVLFDQHQQQLEKSIQQLRSEIQQLIKSSNKLDKQVETAATAQIVEFNDYQLKFLDRVRVFIADLRKDINEAGLWLDSFNKKKKKKNAFWSKAKDKKKGGEQYLFSNEHSVARSAN